MTTAAALFLTLTTVATYALYRDLGGVRITFTRATKAAGPESETR